MFEVPGGPGAENRGIEGLGARVGAEGVELGGLVGAVEAGVGGEQVGEAATTESTSSGSSPRVRREVVRISSG
jgi:hypothetical protein